MQLRSGSSHALSAVSVLSSLSTSLRRLQPRPEGVREYQGNTVRAESFYDSTVEKYAAQDVEVLTLAQMLSFGRNAWNDQEKILKSARYVQRELPKRLARRLLDLQLLPYIVVTNPHIKKVYNQYYVSFETLRRVPPVQSLEENEEFAQLLRHHLDQHAPMLDSLATGLAECRSKELVGQCLHMDAFFDNMLRSRISRRVIAEQHMHISNKRSAYIGIICTDLDVADSVDFAIQKTSQVCMETYGTAPPVVVSGDPRTSIAYIPAHLDYMLYELLKNAMRAVVEAHRGGNGGAAGTAPAKLPAIHLRVCGGAGSLTIRISDQGGGIPDALMDKVWSYGFTTIGRTGSRGGRAQGAAGGQGEGTEEDKNGGGTSEAMEGLGGSGPGLQGLMRSASGGRYRMAGLGFGLPLSRLYARYFGGDLRLQSLPGYGVDAYLTLRRMEDREWQEHVDQPATLPIVAPY